ncbi:MAG TPA: DUF2062 domain-containing protein [Planctomycetota bacterium]|nr:DUF2062 domain-containing protein [Planctomycetota bacterium]
MKRKIGVSARIWARRLLGLGDPPRSIAMGAALGVLIAFGPTYGLQLLLAIGLALLLRVNKAATVLPTFLVNPVTGPPIFVLQYLLGRAVLGGGTEAEREHIRRLAEALGAIRLHEFGASIREALAAGAELGWGVIWAVLVGMAISAGALALLTYPIVFRGVIWFRRKRAERRAGSRAAATPAAGGKPPDDAAKST